LGWAAQQNLLPPTPFKLLLQRNGVVVMNTGLKLALVLSAASTLSACGSTMEQRAATGAIGGAVVGGVVGGDATGAVVGGVAGAAVGAATTPDNDGPHR
jgi:osmotically inducible lipoprotein OsmB